MWVWASFPSPPKLRFCEPLSLTLSQTWSRRSLFLCRFSCRPVPASALSCPRPVNSPRPFPGTVMAHVQLQISRERLWGQRGCAGWAGSEALLALGRLGAAWHWAQLSHTGYYQAALCFQCLQSRPQIPQTGEGLEPRPLRCQAFVVMGLFVVVFGFFVDFWFFFCYPRAKNTSVQGGILGCL